MKTKIQMLLVAAFLTAVIVLVGCQAQTESRTTDPQVQQQHTGHHH
mgnify:CR=1 FL=1